MGVDEAVRQTEAVLRFREEVDRRFAEHGIAGIDEFLRLYREVRSAIDRLTVAELDWAVREARSVVAQLERARGELHRLSALKASLEMRH